MTDADLSTRKGPLTGSCHCGTVKFKAVLDTANAVRCNCSLCRRKGSIMITVVDGSFELLEGEDALTLYQWNTQVAKHYFCKHCGIYTFHRPRSNPAIYRANAGCFSEIDPLKLDWKLVEGAWLSVESP